MSGRTRASSSATVCCSEKSQYGSIPAFSTTLRSCISPHLPRDEGLRSARHQRRRLRRKIGGRALELIRAAQKLAEQTIELAELLRHRRDEFADAFARAHRRRFAQLVLRALQQRFDRFSPGVPGVLERDRAARRSRSAREPHDAAPTRRRRERGPALRATFTLSALRSIR